MKQFGLVSRNYLESRSILSNTSKCLRFPLLRKLLFDYIVLMFCHCFPRLPALGGSGLTIWPPLVT